MYGTLPDEAHYSHQPKLGDNVQTAFDYLQNATNEMMWVT